MPDRYLKAVLTVIAAALVALAVENGTTISRADSGPMKVQVCNEGELCAGMFRAPDGYYLAVKSPSP